MEQTKHILSTKLNSQGEGHQIDEDIVGGDFCVSAVERDERRILTVTIQDAGLRKLLKSKIESLLEKV